MSTIGPRQKIIVAMAGYNEAKYIGSLILQAKQYADEVIVIDDGSTDRTAKVAKLAGATVIRHSENKGYGVAVQRILAEARKRVPDILVILDADSQHDPEEIPSLVTAISEGFDFVLGSRKMHKQNIPPYRRVGQKVLGYFTSILAGKEFSDTESGFRAFSSKAIDLLEPKEKGFGICAEMVSEATAKGLKVTERPISAIYIEDGSTLNPVIHGMSVLNRIMVMISERRPLFFFGLCGAILILLGIVAGITVARTLYISQTLATGTALISILLVTIGVLCIFTGLILNVLIKRISSSL